MTNLATAERLQQYSTEECTGSLKEVWDGTYVWIGWFARGANNRILFSRFVDRIVTAQLTMGERYTTINDFVAYYQQVTDETPDQTQLDRLYAWARGNYDPYDYPLHAEEELNRRRRKFEKQPTERDELPTKYRLQGRRRSGMIVFDQDKAFKLPKFRSNMLK